MNDLSALGWLRRQSAEACPGELETRLIMLTVAATVTLTRGSSVDVRRRFFFGHYHDHLICLSNVREIHEVSSDLRSFFRQQKNVEIGNALLVISNLFTAKLIHSIGDLCRVARFSSNILDLKFLGALLQCEESRISFQ